MARPTSSGTINHPDVFRLLVKGRGWTADRFEEWLGETLRSQLLAWL
jgi:hypothetical protein